MSTKDRKLNDIKKLEDSSYQIRKKILLNSHKKKISHLASSLSCVDIVNFLYFKYLIKDKKNKFILSKGHAASTLYHALNHYGLLSNKILNSYNEDGSILGEHPPASKIINNIVCATGSLGHGMSIGLGLAVSKKILKSKGYVFVVISDGECNEGSIWEAALFASKHNLSQLIVFIDFNKWQATGKSEDIMSLNPLKNKWESFGWSAKRINGHNYDQMIKNAKYINNKDLKPKVFICDTVKGKGVKFMQNDNNWHYRVPNMEELKKSLDILK